jgi:hypothetical protein
MKVANMKLKIFLSTPYIELFILSAEHQLHMNHAVLTFLKHVETVQALTVQMIASIICYAPAQHWNLEDYPILMPSSKLIPPSCST